MTHQRKPIWEKREDIPNRTYWVFLIPRKSETEEQVEIGAVTQITDGKPYNCYKINKVTGGATYLGTIDSLHVAKRTVEISAGY